MPPRLMAHIPLLAPYALFNDRNRIFWGHEAAGEALAQHGKIIQVIAGSESVLPGNAELPGNFGQRRALIISGMAEPGVNIIPNDGQKRNFGAIFLEEYLNRIRISIILGDQ